MLLYGVAAVLIGVTLLVIEAHVTTAGVFGVAGILATAGGIAVILTASGASWWVTVPIAALLAVAGLFALVVVAREVIVAGSQEPRTGPTALIGRKAVVRSWSGRDGQVAVDGALWHAELVYGWEDPLPAPGDKVVVTELEGLSVTVRRPHAWEVLPVWKPSSLSL
ncbi:NfeD family protein [Flexivirga sp.]|uniref:NfeD family protein n=1 Tax=Flexivirga sp. TaxID=1962927 RepID=UPI003F807D44